MAILTGTSGSDTLTGTTGDDTASGLDNPDTILAGGGNDLIDGGAGNDYLIGDSGDDTIIGGLGNDYIHDLAGSDVFIYARGDGSDSMANLGGPGYLKLIDMNPGDITLSQTNTSLLVTTKSNGQQIYVGDHFTGSGFDKIEFANGTSWTRAQINQLSNTGGTVPAAAPLFGGAGDDTIDGTAQTEFAYGAAGNDLITAGDGNDGVYGEAGDDHLDGGVGADTLNGGQGNDLLEGGAGNDYIVGDIGDDTINGGQGNDTIHDLSGSDWFVYARGDGSDSMANISGPGYLKLTDMNPGDITVSQTNTSLLITTKSNGQQIYAGDHFTGSGFEQIHFADGTVWTRAQINQLSATGGSVPTAPPLFGGAGDDTIDGTSNTEFAYGAAGNDLITAGDGNDGVYGEVGDDRLDGGLGGDTLNGGQGNDLLEGGAGNDYIVGDIGDDTINGGQGNDTIHDLSGSDWFVYARGDGSDSMANISGPGFLKLIDMNPGEITLSQTNTSLLITTKSNGQQIYVGDHFTGSGFEQIHFADGTIWTRAQIAVLVSSGGTIPAAAPVLGTSGDDTVTGTAQTEFLYGDVGNDLIVAGDGNDTLYGAAGNDVFEGGGGNDYVVGDTGADTITGGQGNDNIHDLSGNDVYIYSLGDGSDSIANIAGTDVLRFTDINPGEVVLTQSATSLLVTIRANGQVIRAADHFSGSGFEQIQFADGTIWTRAQIAVLVTSGGTVPPARPVLGTSGDDTLAGTSQTEFLYGDLGNDLIVAGDGNDIVYGAAGNDVLDAGGGNDSILGDTGNDTITGGRGNDNVHDLSGNDVYVYALGDGSDSIANIAGTDALRFTDINPGDVILSQSATSLLVTVRANGQVIRAADHFTGSGFEQIQFADGTIWTRAQIAVLVASGGTIPPAAPQLGTAGDDAITGTANAEFLYGDVGNDTLSAGDGADTVYGGQGADLLQGGAGNDSFLGDVGNDTIAGGQGNDNIHDLSGNDVYVYALGDGSDSIANIAGTDVLRFTDINPGEVVLTQSATSLLVTIRANGDVIRAADHFSGSGFEQIQFADGTLWTRAQIAVLTSSGGTVPPAAPLLGTSGDDTIAGTAQTEFLYGDLGNDLIVAGDGNDTVYGAAGNDVLQAGGGNDYVVGDSGADTITGGQGNDNVHDLSGNDVYIYTLGDGSDSIANIGGTDVLRFTDINPGDVILSQSATSLLITVRATSQVIRAGDHFSGSGFEQIQFADGTIWTRAQIAVLTSSGGTIPPAAPLLGTSGPDTLTGTSGAEFAYGDVGDDVIATDDGGDTIYGAAGNDNILAGAGNDYIVGDTGDDTINGGLGNDTIHDLSGSDWFVYARGDGSDSMANISGPGYLKLTDMNPGDITVSQTNTSLLVTTKSNGQQIYAGDHFTGSGFEQIHFADGTIWTRAQINQLSATGGSVPAGAPLFGTAGADTLTGTVDPQFAYGEGGDDVISMGDGADTVFGAGGNDLLQGGLGNDKLQGDAGDDTLVGGLGADTLQDSAGGDTYVYASGDGADVISDTVASAGTDLLRFTDLNRADVLLKGQTATSALLITVVSTGEVITVYNQFTTGSGVSLGLEQIQFADGSFWYRGGTLDGWV